MAYLKGLIKLYLLGYVGLLKGGLFGGGDGGYKSRYGKLFTIHSFFYKNNFIRTQALEFEWRTMGRTMAYCLEQRKI